MEWNMTNRFLGIDFSGGAAPWKEQVRRPSVWVATAELFDGRPVLVGLVPTHELPGHGDGFNRLVDHLGRGDYTAAAIDAPFSVPAYIPGGDWARLVGDFSALPAAIDRPFPRGASLVALAESIAPKTTPKPLRATEDYWRLRKVNTRSTLWNGPRGGAPFAAACITLIARSGRPCWPWARAVDGALVVAFPAAQLRQWRLPYQRYTGEEATGLRNSIVLALRDRVGLNDDQVATMVSSADALDSVLAMFGALAAHAGNLSSETIVGPEGWIAVHH